MRHPFRPHDLRTLPLLAAALALAACAPTPPAAPSVDGRKIVPIDPSRPGDLLFSDALTTYRQAETDQAAARTAKKAGDTVGALSHLAAAEAAYGLARDQFDQLTRDAALCPAVSIRCDNAAYLGGRCSYERAGIEQEQALLLPDAALLPVAQASHADAQARLDGMLADWPASPFVDSAAYFGGRARFELVSAFGVGSYGGAEPLFERSYAANGSGTWADNALYYDGRSEFEEGLAQAAASTAALTLGDLPGATAAYDGARLLFGQAIGAEGTLLARFATSSYRDNAAYYLGRAWFEKPTPDAAPGVVAGAVADTERVANLGNAVGALGSVVALPLSPFHAGALYWRGRAHYALWFHQVGSNAALDLALADLHAVPAASVWRDNALYYAVRAEVHEGALAGACLDYSTLQSDFAASTYTAKAKTVLCGYLIGGALTCPAGSATFTCP